MSDHPVSTSWHGLDRAGLTTLGAMVAAAFGFGCGLSLGLPLLSLVLESRGVDPGMIGVNTAMAGISAYIVSPFVTPIARRFGTAHVLSAALAVTAVSLVGFYLLPAFWMWFPLRLVFHGALGFVFVLTEFWVSALAPADRRGAVLGVYASVLAAGFATGPLMLSVVGSTGILPFLMGAIVLLVSMLPVLIARNQTPDLEEPSKNSILGFVFGAPVPTFAALVFGAVEAGAMSILPLYGLKIGLGESQAALLVSAMAAGNILFQVPIGILSDRFDRPRMLIICGVVGALGTIIAPLVAHNFTLLLVVIFIWGGIIAGLYTVGLTMLGASFSGANLATANATFSAMYATGMMLGPPAIGYGLDAAPPHGPLWVMSAFCVLHLAIVAASALRRHA